MQKTIGLKITEQEYRKLPCPSYSLLSSLSKDGPIALRGVKEDISDLDGIIIGSLVDSIITDGGIPDNVIILKKKPSGKPLLIIKALSERTDLKSEDVLAAANNTMILEELDKVEYYKSSPFSFRVGRLRQYRKYAKALRDPDAMIVSDYQLYTAKTLSDRIIYKYPFLSSDDIRYQTKLMRDDVCEIPIKGMLDFIRIDHDRKIIMPYDLKTGIGSHYEFFENGYLGYNYYLQASLYHRLVTQEIRENHPEFDDYEIDNFRFMFCGRGDFLPIVFYVTDEWLEAGWKGFEYKNIKYAGLEELIEDYQYYVSHPNSPYRKGYGDDEVLFPDIQPLKQSEWMIKSP